MLDKCGDYGFDSPASFINDIIGFYVKKNKWHLMYGAMKLWIGNRNSLVGKFFMAEVFKSEAFKDAIDEISIPFLPFFIKRYITKYSGSYDKSSMSKEKAALLVNIIIDNMVNVKPLRISRASESIALLLNETKADFAIKEITEFSSLLSDPIRLDREILIRLAKARDDCAQPLAFIYYGIKELASNKDVLPSKYFEQAIVGMKNGLAWKELKSFYYWLKTKYTLNILTPKSMMSIGYVLFQFGEFKEAALLYRLARKSFLRNGDVIGSWEAFRKQIRCLERMGGKYKKRSIKLGEYIHRNRKSLGIDDWSGGRLFRTIGWCYIMEGDYKKSILISNESIRLLKNEGRKTKRKKINYDIARAYNNLGAAWELRASKFSIERYRKYCISISMKYHKKCLSIMKKFHSIKWISGSYLNLSIAYRKIEKFKKSLALARESESLKRSSLDFDELPIVLYNKSLTIMQMLVRGMSDNVNTNELLDSLTEAVEIRKRQRSSKHELAILAAYVIARGLTHASNVDKGDDYINEFRCKVATIHKLGVENDKRALINLAMKYLNINGYSDKIIRHDNEVMKLGEALIND